MTVATPLGPDSQALIELGQWLRRDGYSFTTVTPETHRRVLARNGGEARDVRDVFGWSRPFRPTLLPAGALALLERARMLERDGDTLRSRVRFSTLDDRLYVHSAYPTSAADSVFFGPDTYRFVALIRRELTAAPMTARTVVDIGCGSGVGGLVAGGLVGGARVVLADINANALRFAAVNSALAGVDACDCVESDVLGGVEGNVDLVVSNPPYMSDPDARLYRHGGDAFGSALSLRIVRESLDRLAPNGRLILYTGAAIVDGRDVFRAAVEPLLRARGVSYRYEEIDPDVFGEELDKPGYAEVERIAAVGLVASAPTLSTSTQ